MGEVFGWWIDVFYTCLSLLDNQLISQVFFSFFLCDPLLYIRRRMMPSCCKKHKNCIPSSYEMVLYTLTIRFCSSLFVTNTLTTSSCHDHHFLYTLSPPQMIEIYLVVIFCILPFLRKEPFIMEEHYYITFLHFSHDYIVTNVSQYSSFLNRLKSSCHHQWKKSLAKNTCLLLFMTHCAIASLC